MKNKLGASVPWAYIRYKIAQHWGVPPWVVDEAPGCEVAEVLRIWALEADRKDGR